MSGEIDEFLERMPEGDSETAPAQPEQVVPWLVELFTMWREQQGPVATIQILRSDIARELSRRTGIVFRIRIIGSAPTDHDKFGRWLVHYGIAILSGRQHVGDPLVRDLDAFMRHATKWTSDVA